MSDVNDGNLMMEKLEAGNCFGLCFVFVYFRGYDTPSGYGKISLFLIFAFVKDLPINDMAAI